MEAEPPALAAYDFHKSYGDTVAVQGLTFELPAGTVLGLVGPNGAGKTTTIRALASILTPTGLAPYAIRPIKDSLRKRAAAGSAVMVSSHLLSLIEDLCTAVLILHRGRVLLHQTMAGLRERLSAEGRAESLEELFFRLTG